MALLRGVNIGGRQVKMAELRDLLSTMGFGDVATYLQSGNAVFDSDREDRFRLTRDLEEAMEQRFGFPIPAILRSHDDLRRTIDANPYQVQAEADPTKVHVTFVEPMPTEEDWKRLDLGSFAPEELTIGDGVIYMHLPDGMGRSKLPDQVSKTTRSVAATTRNWRTVVSLEAMLAPQ